MRVRLNTYTGLVGYFDLPPYNPPPEVVTWGTRVFRMRVAIHASGIEPVAIHPVEPPPQDNAAYIYDECFACAIVSERQTS